MYRKEKRIPTILALLIILFGIGGILHLDKFSQDTRKSAQISSMPLDVRFTNITETSFTISWFTESKTPGSILVKNNSQTQIYLDDLDTDGIIRPRHNHLVTAKNLKPDTNYQIKILENGPTFFQKTGPTIPKKINLPPLKGTVLSEKNEPLAEALVFVNLENSVPLSGRTDSSGLFIINFNNLRSSDLLTSPLLSDNELIQILIKPTHNKSSTVVIDLKSIRQNINLPPIKIGNTYNFVNLLSKGGASFQNQNIFGISTEKEKEIQNKPYEILFPLQDEDVTTDPQPRFRGIGIKAATILITVNSQPQVGKVVVGNDGTWSWRPPRPLSPGIHQITIEAYDGEGNLITLSRKFIVLKSGERVLGEATPSGNLSPTPTLTLTPTLSPTPTLIISPTLFVSSPTPSPTIFFSPTPSPSPIPPPRSGNEKITLFFLLGGLGLISVGIKFFFIP